MRWRDALVGAILSLVITVAGGIIVWIFTHEPKTNPPSEKLRYTVSEVASFEPGGTKIGIVTIRVFNVGDKAAHDVHGVFVLPVGLEIKEKQIAMSSGPAGSFVEEPGDLRTLNVSLPTLAPGESLTTSLLVSGNASFQAQVGVKSADSVASQGDANPISPPPAQGTMNLVLTLLFWLLGIVALILALVLFWRAYETFPSRNNTAFVYLQQKLFHEAKDLLLSSERRHGSHPVELANLALAFGLEGDDDAAERRFRAASWWAATGHSKAVISYNKATLLVAKKRYVEAKQELRAAMKLSPRAVSRYFKLSAYFSEAAEADPEFHAIVN
jgi:hypothetical protein